jgi:hypothetical protein
MYPCIAGTAIGATRQRPVGHPMIPSTRFLLSRRRAVAPWAKGQGWVLPRRLKPAQGCAGRWKARTSGPRLGGPPIHPWSMEPAQSPWRPSAPLVGLWILSPGIYPRASTGRWFDVHRTLSLLARCRLDAQSIPIARGPGATGAITPPLRPRLLACSPARPTPHHP